MSICCLVYVPDEYIVDKELSAKNRNQPFEPMDNSMAIELFQMYKHSRFLNRLNSFQTYGR